MPPLIAALIEAFDWRIAARLVGLMVAVVIPLLAYWIIVDHPSARGLSPDGDRTPLDTTPAEQEQAPAEGAGVTQILGNRNFWIVGFAIAVLAAMLTTVLANLSLFATDMGTTREQAALLISLFAVVGLVLSPVTGRLCDIFDSRWVLVGILLANLAALFGYMIARDYAGLLIATCMVAISGGGLTPLWSALIADLFELRYYARVMGLMAVLTGASGALAPVASGWIFESTGSYHSLFLGLSVLVCLPLLCLPLIKQQQPTPAHS